MKIFLPSETETNTTTSLADSIICYIGELDNDKDYYHSCYKLVVCLNQTFSCTIDGNILADRKGLIINKCVPHSFTAENARFLVILVKATGVYGERLCELLGNMACVNINLLLGLAQFNPLLPPDYMEMTNNELIAPVHRLLQYILSVRQVPVNTPQQVQMVKAIHFIEENLHDRLWLEDVAMHINLSSNRTRHVFIEQMGMSFSQYVLWRKIKKTLMVAILEKTNLTEACLQFGFTDQSHFNHTFKNILGSRPKEIVSCNRMLL